MSGRVVIVTGASSGIGEATARAFGRAGDRVVLVARRIERLQQLAASLPDALVVPADLARPDDVERVARGTLERYGRIDVLVNNAGLGRYDWLERLSVAEIEAQLQVNLLAPILLTRAVLPTMLAQRRGVIVNVSSVAGRIATPTMSIYNAAKFGLDGFSEALRREVGSHGVHVCVIAPGPVEGTEFGAHGAAGRGLRAVRGRWRQLRWLRIDADRVAAAIVTLADRPRPRLVLPGVYRAMIAVNVLAPGLVDRIVSRAARAARPGEGSGPS
ncbi:MAG: SDR family oxidoreductase [Firmicutes bacterium]|nr:SDR family oxidoreductase [Bacillota bacterium]